MKTDRSRTNPFGLTAKLLVVLLISFGAPVHAADPLPQHDASLYGPKLEIVASLPVGPVIDVAMHRGMLYFIGGYHTGGTLSVADISQPGNPRIVATLTGLGNLRQIECAGDFAYIAARDDGMYVVDLSVPTKPVLRYHYDTLEKATGMAVAHPIAAVGNRHYGVELIDVSDPDRPRFLGDPIGAKEVQSVDLHHGYLYAGVWASREVITADVRDFRHGKVTHRNALDGYGDGVRVAGDFLFAATGHHAPAFTQQHHAPPGPGEVGHGAGHGLEIFSLADPAKPQFLARIKTPNFYRGVPDLWSVESAKQVAVVADTFNGVFVVDVSAPRTPKFTGHTRLPWLSERKDFDAVAAVALGDGVIYAAGYYSGLYTIACPTVSPAPSRTEGSRLRAPAPAATIVSEGDVVRYQPEGQVRAAVLIGEHRAALAAGNGGIHLVEYRPQFRVLSITPTKEIVYDVAVRGNMLYAAESTAGVSAWEIGRDFKLTLKGRYTAPGISAQQIVVPDGHPYALIANHGLYSYRFDILDISAPEAMRLVLSERSMGMFSTGNISPRLQAGRYAAVHWHAGGPLWFDLGGEKPVRLTDPEAVRRQFMNGVAIAPDGRILALHRGGYDVVAMNDPRPLAGMTPVRLPGGETLAGVPTFAGNILLLAAGPQKRVCAVDVADPRAPKPIETIATRGNPSRIVGGNGYMLIPEGRRGLSVHRRAWFKNETANQ